MQLTTIQRVAEIEHLSLGEKIQTLSPPDWNQDV
jgi:hypothetical protein